MNMTTVPDGPPTLTCALCAAALRELVITGPTAKAADIIVAALLPHITSGERMDWWAQIVRHENRRYRVCLALDGDDGNAEAGLDLACRLAAERDADLAREARYAAGTR